MQQNTPFDVLSLKQRVLNSSEQWPKESALSDLVECFSDMKQFVLNQKNWCESKCTIQQLNKIQAQVTNVLLLLEIQKMYIIHFWSNKRRIQASATHLYAILQIFISAVIPCSSMTLFQCKAANKLCVKISQLQDLVKQIMKKLGPICKFFSGSYFYEEHQILQNFFENFVAFLKSIPKIKKSRMFHVSSLLKYVLLVNTLEITNLTPRNQKAKIKQMNSYSFSTVSQKQIKHSKKVKSQQKLTLSTRINQNLFCPKRKQVSCPHKRQKKFDHEQIVERIRQSIRFIFPVWIRRYSIKIKKQSITHLKVDYPYKGKSSVQLGDHDKSPLKQKDKIKTPKPRIRNKSLTKIKNQQELSTKFSPIRSLNIEKQKIHSYQSFFQEAQQNCFLIENQCSIEINQQKCLQSLLQSSSQIFSLQKMNMIEDSQNILKLEKVGYFLKNYIIMKQIQKIVQT